MKLDDITDQNLKRRILEADRLQNPPRVRALEAHRPERAPLQALVSRVQKPKSRQSRVEVHITLVQFRHRLLDGHDNLAFAAKSLTDAIAQSLGVDDADKRLHWQYAQVLTKGIEGVAVKIDTKEL